MNNIFIKLEEIKIYSEKIIKNSNYIIGYLDRKEEEKQNKIIEFKKRQKEVFLKNPNNKNKLD